MGKAGADVERLEQLAAQFETWADQVDQTVRQAVTIVEQADWSGGDHDRIVANLGGEFRSVGRSTSGRLTAAATTLRQQAAQQRGASDGGSGSMAPYADSGSARPVGGDYLKLFKSLPLVGNVFALGETGVAFYDALDAMVSYGPGSPEASEAVNDFLLKGIDFGGSFLISTSIGTGAGVIDFLFGTDLAEWTTAYYWLDGPFSF